MTMLGFLGFAVSWVFSLYYMIRMAMSRVPNAPFRWLMVMNPFNVLFFPSDLTEAGRTYRLRFLVSILAIMSSVVAAGIGSLLDQN